MYSGPGSGDPTGGSAGGGLLIGAAQIGAGLYDSYQNRKASKENTQRTIAANRAAAELAYEREKEMWNMMNMYNSPAAQMQRFKDAGLNPHLIYGQGNSGNAQGFPKYQPPHYEYNYEAAQYGGAIQSAIPLLMSVGTWMQNMRMSEQEIRNRGLKEMTMEETLEQMRRVNPQLFEQLSKKNYILDHQMDAVVLNNAKVAQWIADARQEYRHKFGEDLFEQLPSSDYYYSTPKGDHEPAQSGIRRLQFMEQASKTKLAEAKSSWTDYGFTDPQAIMQLVMGAAMGMAGQQLRLSTHKKNPTVKRERPRGLSYRRMGPNHPDRR